MYAGTVPIQAVMVSWSALAKGCFQERITLAGRSIRWNALKTSPQEVLP